MKKYLYIGMGKKGRVCLLESLADYETIKANKSEIEKSDFIVSEKYGSLQEVCSENHIKLGKKVILLPKPIHFSGKYRDRDHHWYVHWSLGVHAIYMTKTNLE